ncbi:MAG: bifunctional 2-methylcitrate dehydratase/aconitate hydratase [Betaproteobacteria bacterium]|nr:bifunctional 2-methylcitrate dehydratase/aconitate hydratase [Betaproteobacteria bacterium]
MNSPAPKTALQPDREITDIATYVCNFRIEDAAAFAAARRCLVDAIACACEATRHTECTKLLGPLVPGAGMLHGARVPCTSFELDPASAAFNIGTLVRWLDLNDTFTAAQGSHPSDNVAGILATADYLSRRRLLERCAPLVMRDVLEFLIKAYEIQGCIALENDFSGMGLDHVILTRVATASVVTRMLGGGHDEVFNAASNAWLDAGLRVFRQAPCAGSRKGWAAGDASAQAVRLAFMAVKGEMGYPLALSAKKWGFYDTYLDGKPFAFQRPYGAYVIQNAMLKFVAAGMHGQSAVECAFQQHPLVRDRLDEIERIEIFSQRALIGIMDKSGPLRNPADRDHCVQYVVALGLILGRLNPADFEDEVASDPRIDALRDKMVVIEDANFTQGFYDPARRSSANGLKIHFKDGSSTPRVDVEYPAGHPKRRAETAEIFRRKLINGLNLCFAPKQRDRILSICEDQARFEATPVHEFMAALAIG